MGMEILRETDTRKLPQASKLTFTPFPIQTSVWSLITR